MRTVGRNPMSWVQKKHGVIEAPTNQAKAAFQDPLKSLTLPAAAPMMSEDEAFIRSLLHALAQSSKCDPIDEGHRWALGSHRQCSTRPRA